MKVLLQRVKQANVSVNQQTVGEISQGLLLFIGVEQDDCRQTVDKLVTKVTKYRVFSDEHGKMNLSVLDIAGECLAVSQFTLAAQTNKGLRPGFSTAMAPAESESLFDYFVEQLRSQVEKVATGRFGEDMQVSLVNDGPVTFMLEA